ncbi:A/G-specific adenine glycosylase [Paenibacillus sp. N3/727]|uniref:A/G-specific adenine glycosylase n=1 Tax=Paenibacillus sp. N3/727 TaxID=2925845 RepID=UPI001F53BA7B|nr:A/G-specific adenine glycosylase [Paenibacillus sp. N3/727]UNK19227.1 A/G-specific adenine glycosylase [Paenibacillus sp. N3/727]
MNNIEQQRFFSRELLDWYGRNKRDLPWRRHRNPYYIWISEIMLQQTRVDTVIPYFNRFIERFPTVESLADAPEDEVLKCWEGLGYYSRARNLQHAARQVKEQYGGIMPSGKEEVFGLKGVGPYTAGAIRSIAFNIPAPAVDGNVMRVLSRYFLIEEDIMKGSTRSHMEDLVVRLIPEGRASDFNQGLMELGALVCTPKSPKCLTCPVMEHCAGRIEGKEESLPIKTKAKPPRPEYRVTAIVEGKDEHAGKVFIRKRPATGLLAGMWELPHVSVSPEGGAALASLPDEAAMDRLAGELKGEGIPITPIAHFMNAEHTFSHIHWNMRVFRCQWRDIGNNHLYAAESAASYEVDLTLVGAAEGESGRDVPFRWISPDDMEFYAFPNVFLRILNQYFSSMQK